jgi:hypothetical protein
MKHSAKHASKLTLVAGICLFMTTQTKAQSQNWWRTNGNNNIGVNAFIGTT